MKKRLTTTNIEDVLDEIQKHHNIDREKEKKSFIKNNKLNK